MSIEEIMEQIPEKVSFFSKEMFRVFESVLGGWIFIAVFLFVVALIVGVLVLKFGEGEESGAVFAISLVFVIVLPLSVLGMVRDFQTNELPKIKNKEWEKEYVIPYVKGLEDKESRIFDYELKLYKYTNNEYALVDIINQKGKKKTVTAEVIYKEDIKTPYVAYKVNDYDFKYYYHEENPKKEYYKKGEYYFPVLYLPVKYVE